ncbi:MAG TPA: hypothetical protein VN698_12385 [Bacteroidia bacterium]|nr:hypothetical protein [Bacteroidia bacterium]
MSKKSEFINAIKSLAKKQGMICIWAVCKSVSIADTSCTITVDDLDIENIDLGTSKSGVVLYPTQGSDVLVMFVDDSLTGRVIDASQTDNVELMGDANGGIPIAQEILDNLNAIKTHLNAQDVAIAAGLTSVGQYPSSAIGTAAATAYTTAVNASPVNFVSMENQKVKHGNG